MYELLNYFPSLTFGIRNYIKEPDGVDLIVGPSVLTEDDKRLISAAIATYKATHSPLPKDLNEALHLAQAEEIKSNMQKAKRKKTAAI